MRGSLRRGKDARLAAGYHRVMKRQTTGLPSLFLGLSEPERDAFLARATIREFEANAVLYRQGERAQSLFVIRSGRVALTVTSTKGRHIVLRFIGPTDGFGIASLLDDSDDIASALTLTPTTAYWWDARTLQDLPVYYQLVQNAFRMSLQYLKEYGERHVGLLSQTAEQRLARTLVRLGDTNGRVLATGVDVEISNDDLAALSDVGLFTTSRQLKQWERDGHLVKRRRHVLLRDPNALVPKT